jgi:hypothetical protein
LCHERRRLPDTTLSRVIILELERKKLCVRRMDKLLV